MFQEHYEERFIPDPFINSIRSELAAGDEQLEAAKAERDAVNAAKAARKQAAILQSLEDDDEWWLLNLEAENRNCET